MWVEKWYDGMKCEPIQSNTIEYTYHQRVELALEIVELMEHGTRTDPTLFALRRRIPQFSMISEILFIGCILFSQNCIASVIFLSPLLVEYQFLFYYAKKLNLIYSFLFIQTFLLIHWWLVNDINNCTFIVQN